MRPVDVKHRVSQPFGSMKTQGVAPSKTPGTVGYYVHLYGNYQPFGHAGLDIACPEGTPVHAIADGTVLWADWGTKLPGDETNAGYRKRWYLYKGFPGIVTVIQHAGWIGVYAHLSEARMNTGDRVTEAQVIGLSGGTGGVAAHLHVEALVDTSYRTGGGLIYGRTDPEPFFGSAAIAPQSTVTKPAPTKPEEWDEMASEAQLAAVMATTLTKWMESPNGKRIIRNAIGQTADAAMVREVLATVQDIAKTGTNVNVAAVDADAVVDAIAARLDGGTK